MQSTPWARGNIKKTRKPESSFHFIIYHITLQLCSARHSLIDVAAHRIAALEDNNGQTLVAAITNLATQHRKRPRYAIRYILKLEWDVGTKALCNSNSTIDHLRTNGK